MVEVKDTPRCGCQIRRCRQTYLTIALVVSQVDHQQKLEVSLHLWKQRNSGSFPRPRSELDVSLSHLHWLEHAHINKHVSTQPSKCTHKYPCIKTKLKFSSSRSTNLHHWAGWMSTIKAVIPGAFWCRNPFLSSAFKFYHGEPSRVYISTMCFFWWPTWTSEMCTED